jgi:hypothetical protein
MVPSHPLKDGGAPEIVVIKNILFVLHFSVIKHWQLPRLQIVNLHFNKQAILNLPLFNITVISI